MAVTGFDAEAIGFFGGLVIAVTRLGRGESRAEHLRAAKGEFARNEVCSHAKIN